MVRGRGPVVQLDRNAKAKQVEAIITDAVGRPITGMRVLDVGSGNGDIAEFFARQNQVDSVDVEDRRREPGAANFVSVDDEQLPFPDATFDLVLSHHVIEHVSDHGAHLQELRRVVRPDGHVYLATPNRSSPIMEGHVGNDMVLRWPEMRPLLESNGYVAEEYGWRLVKRPDEFHAEQRFGRFLPTPVAKLLRRFYPSHVFMMRPA